MNSQVIEFRPGRIGFFIILLFAALSTLAIWASGLSVMLQVLFSCCVMIGILHALRTWPVHLRWRQLRIREDGILQLVDHADQTVRVEPARNAFLSPIFISFHAYTPDRKRFRIYGFCDQFDPRGYRHLLRWMRYHSTG